MTSLPYQAQCRPRRWAFLFAQVQPGRLQGKNRRFRRRGKQLLCQACQRSTLRTL
uniref:Uncharacterized protein n=1 Tax=Myoviridae sp. ctCjb12 TaxID=2826631 RepID=A0A8S5MQZ4_9CAUD|nr:MAG TPA: hypothetical protein [Myoviridae sp. ctCjb12]